jgi:predicted transcriptional regulator
MTAREDIAFLVGSECRVETLRALDDDPLRPSSLAGHVSCARETAQRNLAGFVDRNWVEKRDGKYRLTAAGRMVLDRYRELERTVDSAERLSVFLANVGDVGERVDPDLLANQTVTTSTPENPHAPIERWLGMVDGVVDSYVGITPIVSRVFNEAAERAIGPETEMELIIDQSVLEASRERFPDALELAFELDQFTLWVSSADLEFGLAICDGHVWVAAYDEFGNVVASVDGGDDAFVAWARETYDEYRERARRAETEGVESASAS